MPSALTETDATIAATAWPSASTPAPASCWYDWHGQHDVVFYLSVAHNHSADENRLAIQQIFDALNPGGLLVIHEYLADTPNNAFMSAFRLTLLYETGTQTYRYGEYVDWLASAGSRASGGSTSTRWRRVR